MPKIAAASIAEHVAHQEAAVIESAMRLFAERGAADVTLGDIADAVGLARTSLYRYFPTKAHILGVWFERVIAPHIATSAAIAAEPGSRSVRLARWLTLQLDFLTDPEHEAMTVATIASKDMPADVRSAIGARHGELYGSLRRILLDSADESEHPAIAVRATLIAGLLRSSTEAIDSGSSETLVREELRRGAFAVAGIEAP